MKERRRDWRRGWRDFLLRLHSERGPLARLVLVLLHDIDRGAGALCAAGDPCGGFANCHAGRAATQHAAPSHAITVIPDEEGAELVRRWIEGLAKLPSSAEEGWPKAGVVLVMETRWTSTTPSARNKVASRLLLDRAAFPSSAEEGSFALVRQT